MRRRSARILEKRTSELQGALLASEQARAGEIQTAVAEALERVAELEAQLKQAEVNAAEPAAGMVELEAQLQAVVAERDAMLAGASTKRRWPPCASTSPTEIGSSPREGRGRRERRRGRLEPVVGRARGATRIWSSRRAAEIESASAAAVARVAERRPASACRARRNRLASESAELRLRAIAELEAQLTSLREELRGASVEHEPTTAICARWSRTSSTRRWPACVRILPTATGGWPRTSTSSRG